MAQTISEDAAYSHFNRLRRISSSCRWVSVFALVVAGIELLYRVAAILYNFYNAPTLWQYKLAAISMISTDLAEGGIRVVLCLFVWVVLRAVSEGLLFLITSEERPRR